MRIIPSIHRIKIYSLPAFFLALSAYLLLCQSSYIYSVLMQDTAHLFYAREWQNWGGKLGAWISLFTMYKSMGTGAFIFSLFLAAVAISHLLKGIRTISWAQIAYKSVWILWIALCFDALISFFALQQDPKESEALLLLSGTMGYEMAAFLQTILAWGTPFFLILCIGGIIWGLLKAPLPRLSSIRWLKRQSGKETQTISSKQSKNPQYITYTPQKPPTESAISSPKQPEDTLIPSSPPLPFPANASIPPLDPPTEKEKEKLHFEIETPLIDTSLRNETVVPSKNPPPSPPKSAPTTPPDYPTSRFSSPAHCFPLSASLPLA